MLLGLFAAIGRSLDASRHVTYSVLVEADSEGTSRTLPPNAQADGQASLRCFAVLELRLDLMGFNESRQRESHHSGSTGARHCGLAHGPHLEQIKRATRFAGAINSSITRYPPTTLDDSPLPPEPERLEDVSALMASIPPFAGGDLNDSTIGHTEFGGHVIAIRWGRDPHTGELVLDVASGPPLPHGVFQDCQQLNLLHGTNHLSIEFNGYKVRSFVSISHPDESGMSEWLSHHLTQYAIVQLIQKGRLERLEGLVSGNVTPADSPTNQGTIADSRQALSESSLSPPSVSTQSKPSSQSWRSDASEWGGSIERLTRTSKL